MNSKPTILLASGSPRRRELLRQLGVTFEVKAADIDESVIDGETPREHVIRLSREKALAGFSLCGSGMPALGSDTIVLLNDEILGKPGSRAEAENMLKRLSGSTHHVYSAVALALDRDKVMDTLNITAVTFAKIPGTWISQYCQTDGRRPEISGLP